MNASSIESEPLRALRLPLPAGITYQSERDGLIESLRAGTSAAYQSGRHWFWLWTHHLWKKDYASPVDFIRGELEARGIEVPHPNELSRRATIAMTFKESVAVELGIDRLSRALSYWGHTGKRFSRDDPGSEEIEIPLPDGSKVKKAAPRVHPGRDEGRERRVRADG